MFQRDDEGFSLVEVIVAMFLLAALAIGILPLIIGATQLSVQNKDLAAANSFASAQLAELKHDYPTAGGAGSSCDALVALDGRATPDPAGTKNTATLDIDPTTCPEATSGQYPATLQVSVTVTDAVGERLVVVSSLVMVTQKTSP